jgi:hypothetical protein
MTTRTRIGLAVIVLIPFLVTESHGDFLIYHLEGVRVARPGAGGMPQGGPGMQPPGPGAMGNPGGGDSSGGLQIILQGKIESKGGIVSFTSTIESDGISLMKPRNRRKKNEKLPITIIVSVGLG